MGFLFSKKKKKNNDEHFAEDDVKKKKGRVTAHDKAVLDLKNQRDKLKVYQKRVCTKSRPTETIDPPPTLVFVRANRLMA